MNLTSIATSPFNCYWIVKGSEGQFCGSRYAVCRRTRGEERLVVEEECRRCPLWAEPEPPADESFCGASRCR